MSQSREALKKTSVSGANTGSPGTYDVCFTQIWPKSTTVTIKPEKKVYRHFERASGRQRSYMDFQTGIMIKTNNNILDFDKMAARKPFVIESSYKEDDSEEVEQKRLDNYIKMQRRPLSGIKKCKPL